MKALVGGLFLLLGAAACAPGTDGILIAEAQAEEIVEDVIPEGPPIIIELPTIPVVRLPTISAADEYDRLLNERLGSLTVTPLDGVEVLDVQCENDEIVYHTDESSDVFQDVQVGLDESIDFSINEDGIATYSSESIFGTLTIQTFPDGSGELIGEDFTRLVTIDVDADGSGTYYSSNPTVTTTVEVAPDQSGTYYRKQLNGLFTVEMGSDGSGQLFSEDSDQKITIDAQADGTGEMYFAVNDRIITVLARPDGSWEFQDKDFDHWISVSVHADGTGQYRERGIGSAMTLNFAPGGVTEQGPDLILPDPPRFTVTDKFPQLGTLVSIQPPCATVVRFDSEVFFDIDRAELRPEALRVLRDVAPALIDAGRSFEINGHTDASGGDDHNQQLSLRRAESVAAELRRLGVTVDFTVSGFGETQPIAPNYNADGSENEDGMSQNRRVELVING